MELATKGGGFARTACSVLGVALLLGLVLVLGGCPNRLPVTVEGPTGSSDVAAPTFSLAAGTYLSPQSVAMGTGVLPSVV